ncbi:hypothetical protein JNUCC42_03640 [Brevibacterium sp. JNUCC-42]|nr:hypothetical protein JNUCC42_03640 [Brevibacterium sp. JNUCC-42]
MLEHKGSNLDKFRNPNDRERGSSTQRGYDAKWRKARIGLLRKHPLCKHCYDKGLLNGATVVDHIITHKGKEDAHSNCLTFTSRKSKLF